MRNLKRALSLLLSSAMVLGMMVMGSSAASYTDVTSKENVEAIEVLKAVGVMTGDENGNFNPNKQVTRAEMAVVMANLLDLKVEDFKGASLPFTDVPEWAVPYVAACYADGITAGISATQYGSNNSVTTAQAALMMMKALGYFQYSRDFGSDWQVATVKQGSKIDLFDGIEAGASAAMTRNDVAQIALNTLEATMVETDGSSTSITLPGGIVIDSGDTKYVDSVSSSSYAKAFADKNDEVDNGKYTVQLGEKLYNGDLTKNTDKVVDDFGAPAAAWSYKDYDGEYATETPVKTYVDGFDADELKDLKDDYDFDSAVVYVNGVKAGAPTVQDLADREYTGTVIELYANDKDQVTNVVLKQAYLAQVTDKDDESISLEVYNPWLGGSKKADVTFKDDTKKSDDTYDKLSAKYDEDDYLLVYTKGAVADEAILATADVSTVSGKVATTKITDASDGYNGYFTIDGTKYTLASGYNEVEIKAASEYNFYLDENGYVIGAELVKDAAATIDEVYYVDNVWDEESTVAGAKVNTYYAQLVAMDGTVSQIELEARDKTNADDKLTAGTTDPYTNADYAGKLVTISDKKWTGETYKVGSSGDTTTTTYKSGDKKYDLTKWAPNTEETWDLYDQVTFTSNFEKTSTRVNGTCGAGDDAKTFRLNSATKYIFVEGAKDKLDVSTYTGGVAYTASKATADKSFVITEDDSAVAKYIVIVTTDADQAQTFSDDAIFVASASSEKGDGYRVQTVYYADGSKKTINVAESEYNLTPGFYTYDTNEDGYYVLDEANKMTVSASFIWEDEEGTIDGATIKKDALFENLLTVTTSDSKVVTDIDVANAKFVDAHDADKAGQYDKTVSSLTNLVNLVDNEKVGAVTLSLNVAKDGAVIIVVTAIAAKA